MSIIGDLIKYSWLALGLRGFLRELANQWVQDEGFREEINAVSGYPVQPEEYITGEEVAQAMLDMPVQLDELQVLFADLIEEYRA